MKLTVKTPINVIVIQRLQERDSDVTTDVNVIRESDFLQINNIYSVASHL